MLCNKTIWTIGVVSLLVNPLTRAAGQGELARIDALITPGFYINFVNKSPIQLQPDEASDDPYHTFKGCSVSLVESNFEGRLAVSARATSAAGGDWKAEIYPYLVPIGEIQVRLCVEGRNVQVKNLPGGTTGVKVAEIRIDIFAQ